MQAYPQEEQERQIENYLQERRGQGFDPQQAPQTRLALWQVGPRRYQFVWMFSYLLQDDWSFPLIMKDLFSAYTALCQNQERAAAFWQRQLPGYVADRWLPAHLPAEGSDLGSMIFERQEAMLLLATTAGLQALARQHQLMCTP